MEYTKVTYFNEHVNIWPKAEFYFKGNPTYEEIGKAIMLSKRQDKFIISKGLVRCKHSFPIGHWRPQGWDHDCTMWVHTCSAGVEGFELQPFNLVNP